MNAFRTAIAVGVTTILCGLQSAHAQDLELIPAKNVPLTGTFYRVQRSEYAPLPYNRFPELPCYALDWSRNVFLIDDRSVNYEILEAQLKAQTAESSEDGGQFPVGADAYGCGLWFEITASNAVATLTLHNTRSGAGYQILTNSDLTTTNWSLFLTNVADGSGYVIWTNIAIDLRTNLFFRACESRDYVTNLVFQGLGYSNTLREPPDSMGAVGADHFVELLNNGIAVYDKAGALITQTNSTNFFAVFGASGTNSLTSDFLGDPRILYDQQSDRWVACAIDVNKSQDVALAISKGDNPTNLTTNWDRYLIRVHREGFQTDFTTLGLDANGIYLRVLFYNQNSSPTTNAGHTIVAIKKPEIYQDPPIVITNYLFITNDVPVWTIQPAVNFDEAPTNGYAWFVAKGPPNLGTNYQGGEILYRRLQWQGTNAVWADTNWNPVINGSTTYRDYYDLDGTNTTIVPSGGVIAPVSGGDISLYETGSRLSTVIIRNGFLWTCQTVGLTGTNGSYSGDKLGTNVDRSAVQWFKVQLDTNRATLTLSVHGKVFDSVHQTNAWWFHYPSLAVNCPGDMVAGFSGSSATNYIGAFYTWRLGNGTTLDTPRSLQFGTIGHSVGWGDYSATVIDPSNEWSFWTVQAYSAPYGFLNLHRWRTVVAEIKPNP
jgi:hypothetical protein